MSTTTTTAGDLAYRLDDAAAWLDAELEHVQDIEVVDLTEDDASPSHDELIATAAALMREAARALRSPG